MKRPEKSGSSLYPWLVLSLLVLIYILSFVDRQIVAVLAPQIQASLELTNLQVGLLYGTAFSLVYAFAGIPMGRLADRWSRRAMVAGGLFLWSAMTVASGLVSSFLAGGLYLFVISIAGFGLGPPAAGWLMDEVFQGANAPAHALFTVIVICGIIATAAFLRAMKTYDDDAHRVESRIVDKQRS